MDQALEDAIATVRSMKMAEWDEKAAQNPFKTAPMRRAWEEGLMAGFLADGRRNAYDIGAGISIGGWPKLVAWELGRDAATGVVRDNEGDKSGYEILMWRLRDAKCLRRGKFCNVDLAGVPLSKPWHTEVFAWQEALDGFSGER